MLRNSNLTHSALWVTYGLAGCAFWGALAFGVAGCQIVPRDDPILLPDDPPIIDIITRIVIENPDASAHLTIGRTYRYWCRQMHYPENPDLADCEDLKIRKPTESAILAEDYALAYYRDRIKEMQAAGELPWFEVDNLDTSYSYAMDDTNNKAELTLEVVATKQSDWDAIHDNWDDVCEAIQKLIDEYLSSTLTDKS